MLGSISLPSFPPSFLGMGVSGHPAQGRGWTTEGLQACTHQKGPGTIEAPTRYFS